MKVIKIIKESLKVVGIIILGIVGIVVYKKIKDKNKRKEKLDVVFKKIDTDTNSVLVDRANKFVSKYLR